MEFLKKLKALADEAQAKARSTANAIATEKFKHPLADKTDWFPLAGGGANFQTHRLDTSKQDQLIFKSTKGAYLFGGIFMFFGLLGFFIPLLLFISGDAPWFVLFFALIFGGIFSAVGVFLLYWLTKPRVFDTFYNCYYKGHKKPDPLMNPGSQQEPLVDLNEVEAIQVIREHIRSNKSSYSSFELNLVMDDASRINVIDHGKYQAVIEDAETLATAMGVPVWDAA